MSVCLEPCVSSMQWACDVSSSVACPTLPYFYTLSHKRHDFRGGGKNYSTIKCVFWFSLQLWSETFFPLLRRTARGTIKSVYWSSIWSVRYSCPIVMKREFSTQLFEKYSYIKFHANTSGGRRSVPCGQMDGRTDTMKLTVAFRNFAKARKIHNCQHLRTNVSASFVTSPGNRKALKTTHT